MKAFKVLKEECMTAAILVFADYTKPFLLETCIQRWVGGSVVAEAGRQVIPPCCLWQQSPDAT